MKLSFAELLVVLFVALLILGPDKLPQYAQKLGAALKEFRKYSSEATKDIRESIVEPLEEAQRPIKEAMEPIADLTEELQDHVKDLKESFDDLGRPTKKDSSAKAAGEGLSPEDTSEEDPVDKAAAEEPLMPSPPEDQHGGAEVTATQVG